MGSPWLRLGAPLNNWGHLGPYEAPYGSLEGLWDPWKPIWILKEAPGFPGDPSSPRGVWRLWGPQGYGGTMAALHVEASMVLERTKNSLKCNK